MIYPPKQFLKTAEHHWLDHFDCDGHYYERVILQWCPQAQKWAHSGNVGTNMYVEVSKHWKYVKHQPMPE